MTIFSFNLDNDHGLHARPAGALTQICSKFESQIHLIKDGQKFNCKSMIGLLKMGGAKGDMLTLEIEGTDELEALEAVKTLIAANFNE